MAEKIRELIRQYQGGKITRREFMRRAVALTGSLAASHFIDRGSGSFPVLTPGRSIPTIPLFFATMLNMPEGQRLFSAISPVPPHRENFPRSSSSMRTRG